MLRKIVKINEDKCDGCGDCIPNCHEGALQIIDGKARLISDLFCDGLGACLGFCHAGAISIEEREAEPYDEKKVMEYIVKGGPNVIKAHLEHLIDHNETLFYNQAIDFLNSTGIPIPPHKKEKREDSAPCCTSGIEISPEQPETLSESGRRQSHLTHWPIQLHLISPMASQYRNSDLLIAADCVGFSYPDFHKDFLKGKSLVIACPKLDSNKEVYLNKLISLVDDAEIKSISVLIMQVPCCGGIVKLAQQALNFTKREVPLFMTMIGIQGEILAQEQL
ncbi:MAG TPA: 4Fe-4S ferredoxin [Ignavibacteriaceae bacterium]|nr:4Fe-4S ferredoxin [Ignavibacteriaceae bacterium]